MENVGMVNGHLEYLTAIWCILWPCGIFFPVFVCCTMKNMCSDKATKIVSKVLFQSVEYIHRRTKMITAGVAAVVPFYRVANSAP
jgi:hypothetical protein